MGDTRTLQQLIDDAAGRADVTITTDSFVTIALATTWVNQAIGKLRGRVIQEYDEDYYSKFGTTTPTSAGTDQYAVPTDFFKLLGVDYSVDGGVNFFDAKRLNFKDRNRYSSSSVPWSRTSPPRYKLFGANVLFRPVPNGIYHFRLIYAPTLTRLSNLAVDTFEFYNGWDRFVGAFVAEQIANKEESDPSPHIRAQGDAWNDICAEVRVRDAGEPARIQDVMGYSVDSIDEFDEEGL